MSELSSLTIISINWFSIHNFFDEYHLPKLKNLNLEKTYLEYSLLNHLNVWQRHRGVQSLTVKAIDIDNTHREFSRKIAQLFPTIKKFYFTIGFFADYLVNEISPMMEPFQVWDLEESKVVVHYAKKSSLLVECLKSMAKWKGSNFTENAKLQNY